MIPWSGVASSARTSAVSSAIRTWVAATASSDMDAASRQSRLVSSPCWTRRRPACIGQGPPSRAVQLVRLPVLDPSTQRLDQLIGPEDGPAAGAGLRLGRMLDQAGEGDQRTRAYRLFDCGGNAHLTEVALQRLVHREPGLEAPHEFRRLLLICVGQGL